MGCCCCSFCGATTTSTAASTTSTTNTTSGNDMVVQGATTRCNSKEIWTRFQQADIIYVAIHIIALVALFSGNSTYQVFGYGGARPIPRVWIADSGLTAVEHLRFNLQWTVVIWSFYLYPVIIADLLPSDVQVKRTIIGDGTNKGLPKWLQRLLNSECAIFSVGLFNCILGFTTIGSYIYQTYEHDGNNWFGNDARVRQVTNFTLCIIDAVIDIIALTVVAMSLVYIPMAHQHLSYLMKSGTYRSII
jgi:hypothetical protein